MVLKTSVLKTLEDCYRKEGNQLYVLYGRADSEKEYLIRAFLKNKKSFYYRARWASPKEQQAMMEREIAAQFQVPINKHNYEEYFKRVRSGDGSKLVVVVDEFQLIAKKDAAFLEAIVKLKMKKLYPGPVMVLLCSTAVAWVEKEVDACFGESGRKRMDGKIKITNLNFLEVVRALPEYSVSECVKTYGVIGGVAGYINRWDHKADLKTNICRHILSQEGCLFGAAEQLISLELRELSVYETILAAIASGCDKLNDLYLKTGFARAKISVYMKNLAAFDIVQKVVSFETGGWDNAKKGVYRIRDNFINFWFRFIYPNLSELYKLPPEVFYETYIENGLDEYLERYFREVCMEYLELLNRVNKVPLSIKKMGTWVGKEGNIDIIAQNEIRQNMVGICNWNQSELTLAMCQKLKENMKLAHIGAEYYFLFSAKDFAPEVRELAKSDSRYILVDMNEL